MTKSTFGEHLRREREMRGVSLQEISTATRISTRFLDALETEQWDRLPGGIFNRGFVRSVAHFLGLDEESLIAEYSMATNDHPEVAVWADKELPPKPKPVARQWIAFVLLLAAAGTIAWSLWTHPQLLKASIFRAPASGPAADAKSPAKLPSAPAPQSPPAEVSAAPAANPQTAASASGEALELKIDVGRETTLTVIADGKRVFRGKVNAGDQQHYRANEKFEVSAGDSHAVLLELNGLTLPPLGPPGQRGQMSLTRDDLRKLRRGQN